MWTFILGFLCGALSLAFGAPAFLWLTAEVAETMESWQWRNRKQIARETREALAKNEAMARAYHERVCK